MSYRSLIALLAIGAIAGGCSGSGGGVIPDPPLELDGEYQIAVETVADGCGFGSGDSSTPILIVDSDETSASVDIPLGGAGGVCSPGPFSRMGNLISRSFSLPQSIGSCVVDAETTTTLEFFADGGVDGSEFNTLTPVSGDCSLFGPACTVELRLTGDSCAACFSCVEAPTPLPAGAATFGTFVGSAVPLAATP